MLRTVIAVVLACLFVSSAEAKSQHVALHPECGRTMPCTPMAGQVMPSSNPFSGVISIKVTMRRVGKGRKLGFRPRQVSVRHLDRHSGGRAAQPLSYGAPSPSLGYSIARPARYIAGRLICAINVNSALAERGIKGTGSALALSFMSWGRSSGPVPGAVAVSYRPGGGHAAIVSRVLPNGTVMVWNPSPRGRGWQERVYRHRAISFRVPG